MTSEERQKAVLKAIKAMPLIPATIAEKVDAVYAPLIQQARQEVAQSMIDWLEHHLFYTALQYDGSSMLHLLTNETKSAEKWEAFKESLKFKYGGKK